MVVLRPINLCWIKRALDDPADLCAHGDVEFRIGSDTLLEGSGVRDLTVSAAALYLLRSLSVSHTKQAPVGDHLFPCCGFCMYDVAAQEDVVICGCPSGEDFEVLHGTDEVIIRSDSGREWRVSGPEWQAAVFAFADRVSEFYATCSPKQPSEEDAAGFKKFVVEWERRRGQQFGLIQRCT